jgi:hypothetical protein
MAPEGGFDLAAWQQNHWVLKNDKQVRNNEPGHSKTAKHWQTIGERASDADRGFLGSNKMGYIGRT